MAVLCAMMSADNDNDIDGFKDIDIENYVPLKIITSRYDNLDDPNYTLIL